jgi:hypothetical protein
LSHLSVIQKRPVQIFRQNIVDDSQIARRRAESLLPALQRDFQFRSVLLRDEFIGAWSDLLQKRLNRRCVSRSHMKKAR